MTALRTRRYGIGPWLAGLAVLVSLGAAVALMFRSTLRDQVALQAAVHRAAPDPDAGEGIEVPALHLQRSVTDSRPAPGSMAFVRGVVLRPDGVAAAGATVYLHRMLTAWPEWRSELVDTAITRADGSFQFRYPALYGLLVRFEHPNYAGGFEEVLRPDLLSEGGSMELRLQPRARLWGYVLNDVGAPVPNARVAIESVQGGDRRAQVTRTSASGGYEFDHVAVGPVRLVAYADSWQPATAPAVVIGDRRRVDLRFDRPTMTPLRGTVLSATSQQPIAGATVELAPINRMLGLVAPIGVETAADGSFLLAGLPRGSMRMLVRHPEHGTVERTQSIGAVASELTIELPPRSNVTGQLVTERFDDVFIGGEVLRIQDMSGQVDYAAIDAEGRFRFDVPISPGSAEIHVVDRRFAFKRTYVSSLSVRISEEATTQLELVVVPAPTVRGRFVDVDGEPVAGVRVRQTRRLIQSARDISTAAWQLDITAFGSRVFQLFGQDQDALLAVSKADGTFELRGQKPGPGLARSELSGFGSSWMDLRIPMPGSPLDIGDVELPRGCTISGRVLRGNRRFAGATVTAVGDDCQGSAVTDLDGQFSISDLMPGTYTVRARIVGQPTGSNSRTVTVRSDRDGAAQGGDGESDSENVLIALEVGRTVRGIVTSQDGRPLQDALVSVRGTVGQIQQTAGDGSFELELPRREVDLRVSLGDRSRQRIISVGAEQQTVRVQLDAPPTCTLRAQVSGLPGPRRLLGALLRLTSLDDPGAATRTRWVEMPDGELGSVLCPSGNVRIEVWCDGYAPFVEDRELVPNEEHNLGEIMLEPGSWLSGIVRDEDGNPVADAVVLLGEETDLDLYEPSVRSGADGRFRIQGVTSRSSRLIVRTPGFAVSTVDLQLPADVLSPDPLEVELERGATIEVLVSPEHVPDGGLVHLRRQGRLLASAELDDRGRAWFANRSAGRYTVQLFDRDFPTRVVAVDYGAKLVRVQLVPAEK